MRTFSKLPSSPDIQGMNDAQWLYCYLNIIKDMEEDDELWKARAKYSALFINPDAVKAMDKLERNQKVNPIINNSNYEEEQIYVNSDFETELKNALKDSDSNFIELPDSNDIKGNPNMSSEDFIQNITQDIDQFSDLQNVIQKNNMIKKQIVQNKDNDDLDIFEIDE